MHIKGEKYPPYTYKHTYKENTSPTHTNTPPLVTLKGREMLIIKRKRSIRTIYCSFQVNCIPTIKNWELWEKMGIKEMTYFVQNPIQNVYRVIVTSKKPQVESMWIQFMQLLQGGNMDRESYHKNKTPFHRYQTIQNKEEFQRNTIQLPAHLEIFSFPLITNFTNFVSFLTHPFDARIDLYQIASQLISPMWLEGDTKKLGKYFMLEAHRKFLVLQDVLVEAGFQLDHVESREALTRRYLVVDPITLVIPLLVACALETPMTLVERKARVETAVEDLQTLMLLYESLSNKISSMNLVIEKISIPVVCAAHRKTNVLTVQYRMNKEKRMMDNFTKKHYSEWINVYNQLMEGIPKILVMDGKTQELTKHLPPTASAPEAQYDIMLMLRLL